MCGKKISTRGKKIHMWKKISTHGNLKCIGSLSLYIYLRFPHVEFFFHVWNFFSPHGFFSHGFSESTLYLNWTLPGCSELPPKVSEFANLCFCGSWQSLISSGKKPARTHKNKNLPTLTPLGGSSDHTAQYTGRNFQEVA